MKPLRIAAALLLSAAAATAHAVGGMADVRIHDRSTGQELPVYWHDGRAYVVGRPGNEYEVVVHNRRGEDLLAVVSVDGVNVLNGLNASPDQSGYVLAPWRRLEVRGWRKSLQEVAAFYFTSLGDSYAGRTGRPANVGVIGVALFQRAQAPWRAPDVIAPESKLQAPQSSSDSESAPYERAHGNRIDAPASAPAPSAQAKRYAESRAAPSAPLGTGHGRREDSPVRYVDFERATSFPAETITIYYDSYRNLVAQGVIATPRLPRDPNPFPSVFVPDPA